MKLQEIMVQDVVQAAPDETIGVAGKRMRESAVGCLVITVAGAVKGIITDRDLLACLAAEHDPYRCQIATHMRRPVHVLRPDEDHTSAAAVMRERCIKRLPIAHERQAVGHRLAIGSRRHCWRRGGTTARRAAILHRGRAHSSLPERAEQRSYIDSPGGLDAGGICQRGQGNFRRWRSRIRLPTPR